MIVTYLVAAAIATLAARGLAHHEKLPYWRRWDRAAVVVELGTIYLIFALTAVVVTLVAHQLELAVAGAARYWINGLIYGAVTVAVLRIDFSSIPLLEQASLGRDLVTWYLRRFEPKMDAAAKLGVARKIGDLRPRQLCRVNWQLFLRHVRPTLRPDVAIADARGLRELYASALGSKYSSDADTESSALMAQELIRFEIERLIVLHQDSTISIPPEDLVPPPPPPT